MVYPVCRAHRSQVYEFLGRQASAEPIRTKIFRSETRQMRKAAGSLYKEAGLPAQPMLARPITE